MSFVEFHGVTKAFGDRVAVRDFSLKVERAERLVLFGPSGCGKTTVLRLIAGLEFPDKGSIQIDNRLVAKTGRNLIMPEDRNVGMVFQDLALWPHMTVRQNLIFGLNARQVSRREADDRIGEILRTVGLESRAAAKPHELSGGEQQRVALARALVLRPSILLMDEPLSNLDEERKQNIAREILDLHEQFAFTLVYVTHDRLEAKMLASRICEMQEGRLRSLIAE